MRISELAGVLLSGPALVGGEASSWAEPRMLLLSFFL